MNVLEIEYGILYMNIVFALRNSIGMVEDVYLYLNALEVEYGMLVWCNVIVLEVVNGILNNVLDVQMGNYGISLQEDVYVLEGQSSVATPVEWCNNVMEEWYGIRIYGNVNAQ